jgi:hypothetical protein
MQNLVFKDSDVLDVTMHDTEGDHDLRGMYPLNFCTHCHNTRELPVDPNQCLSPMLRLQLVPRNFEDLIPLDEDINPSDSCGNNPAPVTDTQNLPLSRIQRVLLTLHDSLETTLNAFGLYCHYPRWPSFEPDMFIPSSLLAKSSPMILNMQGSDLPPGPPYPFPYMTTYRLLRWMNSGSSHKSETEVSRLVKEVIQAEDFSPMDLDRFSVRRSLRALDDNRGKGTTTFPDDWLEADVTLNIPTKPTDDPPRLFTIRGFHYRSLVGVKVVLKGYRIRRALASACMLCPFPEYSPLFQNTILIVSEGPDDYRMISGCRDKYRIPIRR